MCEAEFKMLRGLPAAGPTSSPMTSGLFSSVLQTKKKDLNWSLSGRQMVVCLLDNNESTGAVMSQLIQ